MAGRIEQSVVANGETAALRHCRLCAKSGKHSHCRQTSAQEAFCRKPGHQLNQPENRTGSRN